MTSYHKFSVFWFYQYKYILPHIDIAVLKCPYGGRININFKRGIK
jgi:hypothetical protein